MARVVSYHPDHGMSYDVKDPHGNLLFSSAQGGLCAIGATGVDWYQYRHELNNCFRAAQGHPFAAVSPWVPGAEKLAAQFRRLFPSTTNVGEFELASCESQPEVLDGVINLWKSGG